MRDEAQRVHLIAVQEHVHLHQLARMVRRELIVQRGVALRARLERVEEVVDDLAQRHLVVQLHQPAVEILHVLVFAAQILAQRHDVADKLLRRDDRHVHERLLRQLDGGGVRVFVRIVDHDDGAVRLRDAVDDGGQGGDEVEIKLALQPLLDDLHMQHTQKTASEAKTQRNRRLRLERQRRVVELQLFQRVAQVGVLRAVLSVDAAVDHRARGAVAGQRPGGGTGGFGHGVAHAGVVHVLDACGEVAHVAAGQRLTRVKPDRAQVPDLDDLVLRAGGHHGHLHVAPERALHHAHEHDDAAVAVILAVEHERLQRRAGVALRGRHVVHNVVQHGLNVHALLGRNFGRFHCRNADDVLDLGLGARRVGGGQVDLVDDWQNLQIVLQREIGVRQRLRLHALRSVYDQHRALARSERAADLVVEVHVPRRVDQVERVRLAAAGVAQADGARLDRDAALALEIHVVEQLIFHVALLHRAAQLDEPVGQRGFAVVNVGDDGKIPDVVLWDHETQAPFKANPRLGTPQGGARRVARRPPRRVRGGRKSN